MNERVACLLSYLELLKDLNNDGFSYSMEINAVLQEVNRELNVDVKQFQQGTSYPNNTNK